MNSTSFPCLALNLALTATLATPAVAQEVAVGEILAATHVHGLALDPADPLRLYMATHHGLFAVDLLSRRAENLTGSATDYMGFSAHPDQPGTFIASGHPPSGGNLGVVHSQDGGATWEVLSPGLEGPVDFHQMAVSAADPKQVWGVHHGATLQRSRDGGTTWEAVGTAPEGIIDLAASALDRETLFAATEAGLRASRDGGATWEAAHPTQAPVSMVEVGPTGRILAFVLGEGLLAAQEPALDWEAVGSWPAEDIPLHLAIDQANPDRLAAATADGRLHLSATGGATWTLVAEPSS